VHRSPVNEIPEALQERPDLIKPLSSRRELRYGTLACLAFRQYAVDVDDVIATVAVLPRKCQSIPEVLD